MSTRFANLDSYGCAFCEFIRQAILEDLSQRDDQYYRVHLLKEHGLEA